MGGIFNRVSASGSKSVIIPTVLRVGKDELDYWTNMTCFYDKFWEFDPTFSTVPISFLHITSVTEIISAQGAEKRVILYEVPDTSQSAAGFSPSRMSHPAYKNNIEVIMDNIVVQPKQYQMEVIIPDSLIGPYHHQGLNRLTSLLEYMERTDVGPEFVSKIGNTLRNVQSFLGLVQGTTDLLDTVLGVGAGSSQMATMNKNSLEAMAKKGRVVVFKKWTGYDYSYGFISKIDISKKPTEDGVYRGSITFQEAPILNITRKHVNTKLEAIKLTPTMVTKALNMSLAFPFLKMTGVMDEAGSPNSEDNKSSWSDEFNSIVQF